MTVERGTNKGNSSRYRPTEAALKRATDRRREGDKVVPLSRAKGGQSCPQSGTGLSGKGGQDRPRNREQELRKEQGRASAPDLPDEGQSGGTRSKRATDGQRLVFVPRGICFIRDWNERLAREGMTTLERSLPQSPRASPGLLASSEDTGAVGQRRVAGSAPIAQRIDPRNKRKREAPPCDLSKQQGDPCHTLARMKRDLARGGKPPLRTPPAREKPAQRSR